MLITATELVSKLKKDFRLTADFQLEKNPNFVAIATVIAHAPNLTDVTKANLVAACYQFELFGKPEEKQLGKDLIQHLKDFNPTFPSENQDVVAQPFIGITEENKHANSRILSLVSVVWIEIQSHANLKRVKMQNYAESLPKEEAVEKVVKAFDDVAAINILQEWMTKAQDALDKSVGAAVELAEISRQPTSDAANGVRKEPTRVPKQFKRKARIVDFGQVTSETTPLDGSSASQVKKPNSQSESFTKITETLAENPPDTTLSGDTTQQSYVSLELEHAPAGSQQPELPSKPQSFNPAGLGASAAHDEGDNPEPSNLGSALSLADLSKKIENVQTEIDETQKHLAEKQKACTKIEEGNKTATKAHGEKVKEVKTQKNAFVAALMGKIKGHNRAFEKKYAKDDYAANKSKAEAELKRFDRKHESWQQSFLGFIIVALFYSNKKRDQLLYNQATTQVLVELNALKDSSQGANEADTVSSSLSAWDLAAAMLDTTTKKIARESTGVVEKQKIGPILSELSSRSEFSNITPKNTTIQGADVSKWFNEIPQAPTLESTVETDKSIKQLETQLAEQKVELEKLKTQHNLLQSNNFSSQAGTQPSLPGLTG